MRQGCRARAIGQDMLRAKQKLKIWTLSISLDPSQKDVGRKWDETGSEE